MSKTQTGTNNALGRFVAANQAAVDKEDLLIALSARPRSVRLRRHVDSDPLQPTAVEVVFELYGYLISVVGDNDTHWNGCGSLRELYLTLTNMVVLGHGVGQTDYFPVLYTKDREENLVTFHWPVVGCITVVSPSEATE